jgi:hypothetical protein
MIERRQTGGRANGKCNGTTTEFSIAYKSTLSICFGNVGAVAFLTITISSFPFVLLLLLLSILFHNSTIIEPWRTYSNLYN